MQKGPPNVRADLGEGFRMLTNGKELVVQGFDELSRPL